MKLAEVVGLLKVNDQLKLKYTKMAIVFEDNLDDNITKTHTELAKDTGIPYDDWAKFLNITEIAGWLNETMRLLSKAGERKLIKDLSSGNTNTADVNAYKALKEYNAQNSDVDNSNVVIMYLPPEEENV
jgi:hypothetical protein